MHVVDAERFASVVQRPGTWTIGIRQWITLRKEVPMLVDRPERFITDLMVDDDEFAEVGSCPVLNHDLPSTFRFCGWSRAIRFPVFGISGLNNKRSGKS